MSDEKFEQGAVEEQNTKIDAIVGDEVLGYEGSARGEHSGQHPTEEKSDVAKDQTDDLADNRPDQVR